MPVYLWESKSNALLETSSCLRCTWTDNITTPLCENIVLVRPRHDRANFLCAELFTNAVYQEHAIMRRQKDQRHTASPSSYLRAWSHLELVLLLFSHLLGLLLLVASTLEPDYHPDEDDDEHDGNNDPGQTASLHLRTFLRLGGLELWLGGGLCVCLFPARLKG